LQDILRARAEANAPCYRLFLHNQTVSISECQVILQKQARKYEKHTKNRYFNLKTSPTCVGRKMQQNEKSPSKLNKKHGGKHEKTSPK